MKKSDYLMFAVLAFLGIAFRLIPHPPNFTPLAAISLFAGYYFRDARFAALPTLAAMIVSDFVLGFYDPRVMATVYCTLLLPVFFGLLLGKRIAPLRVAFSTLAGAIIFFLTTNWAVWAFSGMYQPTWQGLIACYLAGLPFFKLTLSGDFFWVSIIFGAFALVQVITPVAKRVCLQRVPCSV